MVRITNMRPASERDPDRHGLDRRTLLKGAAGAALGASAIPSVIGAAAQSTPAAAPSGEGIVSSDVEGVNDAVLTPPEPYPSYDGVPGNGGTVRTFTISYNPPPPLPGTPS